jgi:hypothetical protein
MKANEGTLTDQERKAYQSLVVAGDLISIIKCTARQFLDAESR